jgi:hypothetical protein
MPTTAVAPLPPVPQTEPYSRRPVRDYLRCKALPCSRTERPASTRRGPRQRSRERPPMRGRQGACAWPSAPPSSYAASSVPCGAPFPFLCGGTHRVEHPGEPVGGGVVDDLVPVSVWAGAGVEAGSPGDRLLEAGRGCALSGCGSVAGSRAAAPRAISALRARTDQPASAARLARVRRRWWSASVSRALPCPFVSAPLSISSMAWSGRSISRTVWARSVRLRPSRFARSVAVTCRSPSSVAIVRASSIGVRSSRATFSISASSSD